MDVNMNMRFLALSAGRGSGRTREMDAGWVESEREDPRDAKNSPGEDPRGGVESKEAPLWRPRCAKPYRHSCVRCPCRPCEEGPRVVGGRASGARIQPLSLTAHSAK